MIVIAIDTLLWLVGSTLYFAGAISGTEAATLGIVVQVPLLIMIRPIGFHPRYLRFYLEPRPFYPGYRER